MAAPVTFGVYPDPDGSVAYGRVMSTRRASRSLSAPVTNIGGCIVMLDSGTPAAISEPMVLEKRTR